VTDTLTSRRRFLRVLPAAAAAASLALAGDSILYEPNLPRLVRVEIPLARLPRAFDGFTIVQLSDFHYDPYFSVVPMEAAVRMANDLRPDLIVLTGDFVSSPLFGGTSARIRAAHEQAEPCVQILESLRAPKGVWAVLGNHDAFTDPLYVEGTLQSAGIQVLSNSAAPLERDGRRFWLAGVRDVMARMSNLSRTLRQVPSGETVVLLAHEPDFADTAARRPIDLQLSGHSHGGQVRLPFVGAIYLPPLGRKYPSGLRQIERLTLYTNVGIGTLDLPVRWNCPPEVTLITLRSLQA
jgi:uncharacterized protein